jgi:hypothetical protein
MALVAILVGLLVAAVGGWSIIAHDVAEGPVVVKISAGHGLHRGEVPELGLFLVGIWLVAVGAWVGRFGR